MSEGIGEQQVIYLDKLTTHFCLASNSCPTFCGGVINGRIIREQSSRSILFCSFVLRQVSLSIPYKMIILYPWNDQIPHNIPTCQHAVDHWSTLPSLTPPFMSQSRGRPFWIT